MIALNPQPLPPRSEPALATDVTQLVTSPGLRPVLGGCPGCTSGRFLIWQAAVDGENPVPLQVTLPNVAELG